MHVRQMARFCAFCAFLRLLYVSVRFFSRNNKNYCLQKSTNLRRIVQNVQTKCFYAIPPSVIRLLRVTKYLIYEVFLDARRSNKENPSVYWKVTLSCPFMASNYVNPYLVLVSFWSHSGIWMLTMPWIFHPISFCSRASRFVVFQTKVAHLCFCLVHIKMP